MQPDIAQETPTHIATTTPETSMGPAVIAVDHLSKHYKVGGEKVHAVNDVSLTIHEGEFVAIVGASGSGKSTLLQLMGGLDKPTSGTVAVSGVQLGKMRDSKLSIFRNQTIGFVFQFFYLQPFLSLERNIEVAAMPSRMKNSERKARIVALAEQVGLGDRLRHLPRELSGGQIQRTAIARALVNQPKIILADEPTGNLDSENSQGIISLFEQIRKEHGTTVVIATHDQAIATQADRIITIKDGMVV